MRNQKKVSSLFVSLILALACIAGLGVSLAAPAAPAVAEMTDPSIITVIPGTTGRLTNYTTTSRYIGDYTILGYLGSIDFTTASATQFQTVTAYIQVSPDNSTWYNHTTIHSAVSADATLTPDNIEAVGLYVRVLYVPSVITTTTSFGYTPTITLIAK